MKQYKINMFTAHVALIFFDSLQKQFSKKTICLKLPTCNFMAIKHAILYIYDLYLHRKRLIIISKNNQNFPRFKI